MKRMTLRGDHRRCQRQLLIEPLENRSMFAGGLHLDPAEQVLTERGELGREVSGHERSAMIDRRGEAGHPRRGDRRPPSPTTGGHPPPPPRLTAADSFVARPQTPSKRSAAGPVLVQPPSSSASRNASPPDDIGSANARRPAERAELSPSPPNLVVPALKNAVTDSPPADPESMPTGNVHSATLRRENVEPEFGSVAAGTPRSEGIILRYEDFSISERDVDFQSLPDARDIEGALIDPSSAAVRERLDRAATVPGVWELDDETLRDLTEFAETPEVERQQALDYTIGEWFSGPGGLIPLDYANFPLSSHEAAHGSGTVALDAIVGMHRSSDLLIHAVDFAATSETRKAILEALLDCESVESELIPEPAPIRVSTFAYPGAVLAAATALLRAQRRKRRMNER